jgi:hypothetical protein
VPVCMIDELPDFTSDLIVPFCLVCFTTCFFFVFLFVTLAFCILLNQTRYRNRQKRGRPAVPEGATFT